MTDQLKIRNTVKAKKPKFTRSDSHKKIRVGKKWRRPRGIQSKVRLQKKGFVRKVKIGWGSPKSVKGLNKKGIKEILVNEINDLGKIEDKKNQGIIFSSSIGKKKKIEIIKEALKQQIMILNINDPEGFIKKVEEQLKNKKLQKDKKHKEKEKKEKEKAEKAKKKEKKDKEKDELTDKVEEEEKKKKEKDKILIKKGSL